MVKVTNESGVTVHAAGRYLDPWSVTEIPHDEWHAWLTEQGDHAQHILETYLFAKPDPQAEPEVTSGPAGPKSDITQEPPITSMLDAIRHAMKQAEAGAENVLTSSGKPSVEFMQTLLSRDVSAAERDEAWDDYQLELQVP